MITQVSAASRRALSASIDDTAQPATVARGIDRARRL
jgi:hypothetical protein